MKWSHFSYYGVNFISSMLQFADKECHILNGVSFFYCCFDLSLIMFSSYIIGD